MVILRSEIGHELVNMLGRMWEQGVEAILLNLGAVLPHHRDARTIAWELVGQRHRRTRSTRGDAIITRTATTPPRTESVAIPAHRAKFGEPRWRRDHATAPMPAARPDRSTK